MTIMRVYARKTGLVPEVGKDYKGNMAWRGHVQFFYDNTITHNHRRVTFGESSAAKTIALQGGGPMRWWR